MAGFRIPPAEPVPSPAPGPDGSPDAGPGSDSGPDERGPSADEEPDAAIKWAKKTKFTWPTILIDEWEAVGLADYNAFAGEIRLIDATGQVLAEDEDDAFAQIAALK